MLKQLEKFNQQRSQLISELNEKLGYEITTSDIQLDNAAGLVTIRSINGVFFNRGERQDPAWGRKSYLPKEFKQPTRKEKFYIGDYLIIFDDSFYNR